MADTKVFSDGYVSVWWVPSNGFADIRKPTAAEINAGVALSDAISWQDYSLGNTESDTEDDRSLMDRGNATTRGAAQFAGTLSFFRPFTEDVDDPTNQFAEAFAAFREPRVFGYLVVRILQNEKHIQDPAAPGQWVSIYKFMADSFQDDTEGDDSVKYTINFLPQGDLAVYTMVETTEVVDVDKATVTVAEGASDVVVATVDGKNITQGARWRSDDPEVATVSPNGVITGQDEGTATITVSWPAAGGDATVAVTVGN